MPRLVYPGEIIVTTEYTLGKERQFGRYRYTLPFDDIVADVFDFALDDDEPRRVQLRPDEWEPVEAVPDVHEECYERSLFDE